MSRHILAAKAIAWGAKPNWICLYDNGFVQSGLSDELLTLETATVSALAVRR